MIERSWFHDLIIVPGDGLSMLFDLVAKYFSVPLVAKEIVVCWLISIFLQDYSPIKPGIRVWGPASSGKSVMLQLIYWLFYGGEDSKLPTFTTAGLWRRASIEPLIMIDNENVEYVGESLRTFLDLCSTGGKRVLGGGQHRP